MLRQPRHGRADWAQGRINLHRTPPARPTPVVARLMGILVGAAFHSHSKDYADAVLLGTVMERTLVLQWRPPSGRGRRWTMHCRCGQNTRWCWKVQMALWKAASYVLGMLVPPNRRPRHACTSSENLHALCK